MNARLRRITALLGVVLLGGAGAQGTAEWPSPSAAVTAADTFGPPRVSSDGGMTRVVFDLPPGVSYALIPTPAGLQMTVTGARVPPSALTALGQNGLRYHTRNAQIYLSTPFVLGPGQGWRASETTVASGARVLILDFGAGVTGGAAPTVRGKVVVSAVAPPVTAPATSPPPAAPLEDGREANVVSSGGRLSALVPVTPPPAAPAPALPTAGPERPSGLAGRAPGSPRMGMTVGAPRLGRNPGLTRLVLDLPPGASYQITPGGRSLRVELPGLNPVGAAAASGVSPEVRGWRYEVTPTGLVLTVDTGRVISERGGWRGLLLLPSQGVPHARLVLDVSPALADHTPLAPREQMLARVPALAPPRGAALLALPATQLRPRVVLDPGHGGRDPGAVGSVTEEAIVLDVARRVRALLGAAGVEVVMTRDGDYELHPDKATDLRRRAELASGAHLFVSIHANAMPPAGVLRGYGIETWWNPNHPGSEGLAHSLQTQMVAYTSAHDRGVRNYQPLGVLRHNRVPAALVEIGFISHPVDGLNLQNGAYLDRVALGIASGITQVLTSGVRAGGS